MNTKAIAAISMVAVMLMASVATIGFATSSAENEPTVGQGTLTASVDLGKSDTTVGENVLVWFAESQYSTEGVSKYVVTWYAKANETDFNTNGTITGDSTSGWIKLGSKEVNKGDNGFTGDYRAETSVDAVGGLDVSLGARSANSYTLNIKNSSATSNVYLTVACMVSLTMGTNTQVSIDPTYYNITVNLVNDSMNLEDVSLVQFTDYGAAPSAISGLIGTKTIADTAGDNQVLRSGYIWYAQGLPEGLAMSADGKIIGTPLKVTSPVNDNVKVTAVDKATGQTYSSTMKVTVTASTSTPTVSIEVTSGQTDIYNEGDVYYVQEKLSSDTSRTFIFTVSTNGGATLINVVSVDSNGKYTTLTASSETYSADFAGTGSYKIFAYAVGGDKIIYDEIQVYVVPAGDGAVNASIVASSTSG